MSANIEIKPFVVAIDDAVLGDLRQRLSPTRWPDELADVRWDYGTDLTYLKHLVTSWGSEFDWRSQERK
ncbi:MAG: epoxide hydrolase N-terminal domain-containing protein [Betaproteobacteria bacterium]